MFDSVNLLLILAAAFVATISPGPATFAIAGAALGSGRKYGLALASGVTTGSITWSIGAAAGLSTIMIANTWLFEVVRHFGALYLMWLAYKSARVVFSASTQGSQVDLERSLGKAYTKGLKVHLTNPKAVLFFGSLYSIGIPAVAGLESILLVIVAVGLQSFILFHLYALLFSLAPVVRRYVRLRRWFEGIFAVAFGAASLKVLTAELTG